MVGPDTSLPTIYIGYFIRRTDIEGQIRIKTKKNHPLMLLKNVKRPIEFLDPKENSSLGLISISRTARSTKQ